MKGVLGAGGMLLAGCSADGSRSVDDAGIAGEGGIGGDGGLPDLAPACPDPFFGGTQLGTIGFQEKRTGPFDRPFGAGLDGRLYTDLSVLTPDQPLIPSEHYYVRTRYPDLLDPNAPWKVAIHGLVKQPVDLTLDDLSPLVAPMGSYVMECSGNHAGAGFGLLSAAKWDGVPIMKVLEKVEILPAATRVLVSGFDMYSMPSAQSQPGASWIFTFQQLADAGAFFATRMNGAPLLADHGFPIRLYVPNWYGCTCIKWMNEIILVDDTEPATAQMKEFAGRTMQSGMPSLAKDYIPASMDQAAMPVRVEKWRVAGSIVYRVVGIMWGGYQVTDALQIRFDPNQPWVRVSVCPPQSSTQPWTLWSHAWRPAATGMYDIAMKIADPAIPMRRLNVGFYNRPLQIDEV